MRTLRNTEDVEEYIFEAFMEPRENSLGIVSRDAEVALGDIQVSQSVSLLYQHSTGGCVWNTTPLFAEWIRRTDTPLYSSVKDKTVLELGSGTGALAMLIHELASPRYIATDQKSVLKLCSRNCEGLTRVEVREFDWEEHEFEGVEDAGVIVACDTIYNDYLVDPFCDALASVWRSSPNIAQAIVAVQLRDLSVIERALETFVGRFGPVKCYRICNGFAAFVLQRSS